MWDLGRFVLWSLKERDVGTVLLTAMVLKHSLRFRRKIWEIFWSVLYLNKFPGLQNGMEWPHAILASVALIMINHSSMEQEGPHFSDYLQVKVLSVLDLKAFGVTNCHYFPNISPSMNFCFHKGFPYVKPLMDWESWSVYAVGVLSLPLILPGN